MDDNLCFSETEDEKDGSKLGDWTRSDDCSSLDENCYSVAEVPEKFRSGSEVLLLSTLPAAALLLAEHLLYPDLEEEGKMPRRHHREQILEVTKTVTVTEIVNHGAGKHPRACEVTITNLESDTSHPVSVKISHMREGKRLDHNEAGTQTPKIQVDEDTWDAVRTPANGTTKIVQEQESRVERIRRINPPVTTTFNLASDNIIDLHFTQPVLIEKADKQPKSSTAAARHTATADDKTMYKAGPVQKLYYQTFSGSDGLLEETGVTKATICSPSPPTAASATSVRTAGQSTALPRSSVLDETDLGSMASNISSDGSVIVYADARPRGRASSAQGYFTSFPDSATKSKALEKSESDGGGVATEWSGDDSAPKKRPEYIVTGKKEAGIFHSEPTIRWIYAEFDPMYTKKHRYVKNPRITRCQMNGATGSAEILVHARSDDEQIPGTSKTNGQAIFNRSSSSDPKGADVIPPKPARTALTPSGDATSESSSFAANDAFTKTSPRDVESDNAHKEFSLYARRRSTPPPRMTSTPYTSLERKDRSQMELISDGRELRQSHSFPKVQVDKELDEVFTSLENANENEVDGNGALLPPLPPRVPSSPIVVINKSRKNSSEDTLDAERKQSRKSVNDIDWFAAFNMKEPTPPKSPSNSTDVDVMREAEAVGEHSHAKTSTEIPPKTSEINLEEVFCVNKGKSSNAKECKCNACNLTKLSDEERAAIVPPPKPMRVLRREETSRSPSNSANSTPAVNISLEDVFNPKRTSPIHVVRMSNDEEPIRPSRSSDAQRMVENQENPRKSDSYLERETMSFERSRQNCSEIDLDEIYPIRKEAEQPRGSLQEYGNPKPFQDNFVQKETRSSSVPVESNLDWVASLVGSENGSKENDIGLAYSKPIVTQESMTTAEPLPNLVYSKPIVTQESVTTVEPLPNLAYSKPTVTQRSMATAEPLPNGHKDAGADDWLRSLVTSEHPAPTPKEPVDQKITKEQLKDIDQSIVQPTSAPEPINDLIHKVFDREDDPNVRNSKKCSCAACETDATTTSTPVPAERKRRLAQKEEMSRRRSESPSSQPPPPPPNTPFVQESKRQKTTGVEVGERFDEDVGKENVPETDYKELENASEPTEPVDPEAIHFPPGRTLLVGEVLRKPSVLEETSFNIDHLSPISDVSKAYTQRLTQLKSELGLDEMDLNSVEKGGGGAEQPAAERLEQPNLRPTFYQDEPDSGSSCDITAPLGHRAMSDDETFADAVFTAVFEGESSEMTSLAAATTTASSSSQTLPGVRAAAEEKCVGPEVMEDKPNSSFDDWYDNPTAPPSEENEVKDYVEEMLNQSMDEAIFSASRRLRDKDEVRKELRGIPNHTDTSVDRKNSQAQESVDSTSSEATGDSKTNSKDPLIEAVFTSTIDKEQLMESVISYPASTASSRVTSSVTTPGAGRTLDDSEVFFPPNSSLPPPPPPQGEMYVSSASVLMNDTHSSSEGDFDEDYIMKLVFSEKNEEAPAGPVIADTPLERVQRTIKQPSTYDEMPSEMVNSTVNSEVDNRSLSSMENDSGRADEELLEIEVFPGYFHIKGSYSLVIHKGDPLGELLSEVHAKGSASSMDFSIAPKLRRMLVQCFKEKNRPPLEGAELISSRARNLLTDEDVSDIVYTMMKKNRYNAETNPEGNINFCTAENNVCTEEMMTQLKSKGYSPVESHLVNYPPAGGHLSTKQAVARYMAVFMSADVREEDLVILPSSTSAYDMLCHCTCEAEDVVLTSAPTYAASVRNCGSRAECRIRPIEINMESPRLDVDVYQRALDDYSARGAVVRAILIINPHNPLGAVFPPDDVIKLCDWATSNNLIVLIDESFTSCVFAPDAPFKSFLSYKSRLERPENVMYFWSLSKDFGVPGLKISVVHTPYPKLAQSLATLELIHPVSGLAHDVATAILADFDWLRKFNETKLARLSAHYKFVESQLREMGLPFTPAVAGCFVMIDFRKHLRSQTFADELSLFQSLCDKGVMLTPGQHVLCQQPGWMRLVFSCDKKELIEGIYRMRMFFNMPIERETLNIVY